MIDELKQYLKIDRNALDEELERQASIFYRVGELFAEATAERDAQKEHLATVAADLEQIVRGRLGDKATEGKVKSLVLLEEEHAVETLAYLKAKANAEKLQALKEAFQQRGYMLRDLAQLFVANYWGKDSVRSTPKTDEAVYKAGRHKQRLGL